ncbi:MAG TPA: DUF4040 domain-containing protein [Pseudonocardiaceae bacterium]|jgi:energy-converting hydrogenase B subunit D|nr:DUF4040 domain-containing protein [Pseudonocardiaceae bacterium]
MTTVLLALLFTLVAVAGTVVVWADKPGRQAVVLSVFGLALTVLFVVLQAPDVALSQLAVGTAVVPLMVLLTTRKVRRLRGERR